MISLRSHAVPALLLRSSEPGLLSRLRAVRTRVLADKLPGLPTGLRGLDEHMGGLQQGVHILAAAPGVGKTTLALQIARSAASAGATVVYLAFDEDSDHLALKLTAGYGGLVAADYWKGKADPDALLQAEEVHRDALSRIRICNGPADIQGDAAGALLNEAKSINGTEDGLLVVDFLQSWAARFAVTADLRLAVSHLVGQLREVAISCHVPVLAIMAQNRPVPAAGVTASLPEPSDTEYTADSLCFLTDTGPLENTQPRRRVTLTCRKNRWGASFTQRLVFDAEHGAFTEDRSAPIGVVETRQRAEVPMPSAAMATELRGAGSRVSPMRTPS